MPFHKNTCIATVTGRPYTFKFCGLLVVALLLLLGSSTTTARAFSHLHYNAVVTATTTSSRTSRRRRINTKSASRFVQEEQQKFSIFAIRGGEQQEESLSQEQNNMSQQQQQQQQQTPQHASLNILAFLAPLGTSYKAALDASPIFTKSATACLIFALSDFLAQMIENKSNNNKSKEANDKNDKMMTKNKKKNTTSSTTNIAWKRLIMSAAVGFFYFGPVAHAWYDMIFRIFPGTSLMSTLQKAAAGQMLFGPCFMCIFFASTLLQSGQFSLSNWWIKIRKDLWGAWLAGIAFWPLVDVISYSVVPVVYIPLFVNMCSLVWTIYLSNISNRSASTDQTATSSSSS